MGPLLEQYVKVIKDGVAYYFLDQHYDLMIKSPYQLTQLQLKQFATFAVDLNVNAFVKCRDSIESIVDSYTKIKIQ